MIEFIGIATGFFFFTKNIYFTSKTKQTHENQRAKQTYTHTESSTEPKKKEISQKKKHIIK